MSFFTEGQNAQEPMLRFFEFSHLQPSLQGASSPFAGLAKHIVSTIERSAERTVALRKLLESKDAAVRASLPSEKPQGG